MVNFYPPYVNCSQNATLKQVAGNYSQLASYSYNIPSYNLSQLKLYDYIDHIDYIKKVAGVEHVGIGSDFNGIDL